jgi:RNA polymerase sigma-70 factor, ECF subfamily
MSSTLRLLRSTGETSRDAGSPDDEELVRRLAKNDPRAAVLVFRAYSTMVRGMIVRSAGHGADVEDLVQDVFSIFFRKVATLKDPSALRSFLFGITIREVHRELRRRRVRKWLTLSKTGETVECAAPTDDVARHAFGRLQSALATLDPRAHLAFVLRHVEGYELVEVADALSCSLATVKRVLAAAEPRIWSLAAHDPHLAPYLEPAGVEG